jgi:hypothetical protein
LHVSFKESWTQVWRFHGGYSLPPTSEEAVTGLSLRKYRAALLEISWAFGWKLSRRKAA